MGVVVPKIATMILAFVPPSAQGPAWMMRLIWSVLALAVPIAVRGQAIGCLYASHTLVDGLFDEDAERLAEYIATLAGA